MAKNQTKRIEPSVLLQDEEIYAAVKGMADYSPANQAYARERLDAARSELELAHHTFVQAQAGLEAARDTLVAKQWEFHHLIQGTKNQVIAQYGEDSDQVQAVKLKKKSEYKSPARKKSGAK